MASIKSPVDGFTGIVVGVHFKDGFGETDNEGALNYFGRHGYTVETVDETKPEPPKLPEFKQGDEAPAGNASTDEWKAWAVAQGKTAEELDGLGRGEIRALLIPATE